MERANKIILLLVAALVITLCAAGCGGGGGGGGSTGGGTNPPGTATVTGTLLDSVTHQPLTGVVVSVGSNLTTTTNSSGAFSIADVPVGVQTLGFTLNSSSIGSQQINVVAPTSALGNIDVSTEGNPPPAPPI